MMTVKYVDQFEFPAEAGFTGSASDRSTTAVRGYERKRPGLHEEMLTQGKRLGFKEGGQVKMADMDNALTQRGKSVASNKLDQEFGDQGPLKPGYRKGGKIKNFNKHDRDVVDKKMSKKIGKGDEVYGTAKPQGKNFAEGGSVDSDEIKELRRQLGANFTELEAKRLLSERRKGGSLGNVKKATAKRKSAYDEAMEASQSALGIKPINKRVGGPVAAKKGGLTQAQDMKQDVKTAKRVADQEIGKHVRSPAPKGHGIKVHSGKPMFGKD
jgi:hypothetical protein